MMSFIKTMSLLYFLSLSAFAQTSEKSNDDQLTKGKTILTVAIQEIGYFPFYYTENGKLQGFSIDILDYVAAHSKYEFEYIIRPWPRAIYLATQGEIDILMALVKTPKREQKYHFIEPSFADEVNQLFTLMGNDFEFAGNLKELIPYSIGTVRGYSYGEYFDQASYLNKSPALSEEILLKLLLSKQIDMLISNPLLFNNILLKESSFTHVKAIKPYISLTPVYTALTKRRKDASEIKKTMSELTQQLKLSPYYQILIDKYNLNPN